MRYDGIKEKNQSNRTPYASSAVKATHSRPRDPHLNPRRAKLFLFFIYYVVVVRYNGIKENVQLILMKSVF